jgi:putative chitinase
MINAQQLKSIFHEADESDLSEICDPLNAAMQEFGIDTPQRQAMFLAQAGHESGNFAHVEENLNYSASGLVKIFHKYFPDETSANAYAKQPEKIANRVYANRMGNGDESSGDGYRYRGRGLIQLTGKDNYDACAKALNIDLHGQPDYLETAEGACRSAAWFWSHNNLNRYADADDIVGCTKRVNGGTIGLEERTQHYESAKSVLLG